MGGLKQTLKALFKRNKKERAHPEYDIKRPASAPAKSSNAASPSYNNHPLPKLPGPPRAGRPTERAPTLPPIIPSRDRLGPGSSTTSLTKPIPPSHPLASKQHHDLNGIGSRNRGPVVKSEVPASQVNGKTKDREGRGAVVPLEIETQRVNGKEETSSSPRKEGDTPKADSGIDAPNAEEKSTHSVNETHPRTPTNVIAQRPNPTSGTKENERPASPRSPTGTVRTAHTESSPRSMVSQHEALKYTSASATASTATTETEPEQVVANGDHVPPSHASLSHDDKMLAVEDTLPMKTVPILPGMSATSGPLEDYPEGW